MALVFDAPLDMSKQYKDCIVEVSDKVSLALRDGIYSIVQDAIEQEIDEFLSWYGDAAIVYGYLLGTGQCSTKSEAFNEFFNDVYENLGF